MPNRMPKGLGLRLELASGPGEDFRYDLSFDEFLSHVHRRGPHPRWPEGHHPPADVEFLEGATLDHTETQGLVIRNPNRPAAPMIDGLTTDDELSAEIEALVAGEVNPALAAHGGFVTTSATTGRARPTCRWAVAATAAR